ncbi:MAG: metallophosphoesterase [Clostridia bacterium]|nr:metallophosphoesterase [Clostridia bacterium]
MKKRLDLTPYTVENAHLTAPCTLALVTDMHNCKAEPVLDIIDEIHPTAIVIAGDQMSNMEHHSSHAMFFLREAAKRYPVFYGLGNHEKLLHENDLEQIRATGVTLLCSEFVHFGELCIGALEPEIGDSGENHTFLEAFCKEDGYRVLISHRPEWYRAFLWQYEIPLILSGHAHGGQIRFFGHPVYSPGQGLFPKYAQGMHEGRLIVSRGLGNHTIVPRIGNTPELCMVTIR